MFASVINMLGLTTGFSSAFDNSTIHYHPGPHDLFAVALPIRFNHGSYVPIQVSA